MSRYMIILCILSSLLVPQIDCSHAMKRLFEDLFSDYNRLILPTANNRSRVTVTLGLKLGQILDLNLKQQILSTNIWLEQSWFDYKLQWDPAKYLGIDMIHVPAENIWIPDIVLFNNADGNYELTMMTKAKVFYNGSVIWKPPTMFKSTCEIDVAYFPFDIQMCLLRFGSWTYAGDELELKLADQKAFHHQDQDFPHVNIGIDLSEFHKNVEWDVIEVPAIYNEEYYDCCKEPYPDITFKIVIRRKILFYMVNLILPTAMMAFMTICVFYLPSKSDEKVTLSISILMALIVFFTMMLEIIPASSLAVPLFGKYLLFTLVLVFISTTVTVFVLNIHYRTPSMHTMSPWTRKVFLDILPWWLGMKRPDMKERSSLIRFRKKRARKMLCSNNRVCDSSIARNAFGNRQTISNNLNEAKLGDLIEETEDEEVKVEDDEGRYFRRIIDKYGVDCDSIDQNYDSSADKDANNKNPTDSKKNQQIKSNVSLMQEAEHASTINNLRNRSKSNLTNFISLDSNNTELRTLLDSGHSVGQQTKDSNNSMKSRSQWTYKCAQSNSRHPHVYMHNEDTLDMTFDYYDDLPTPPPPPPPLPSVPPPSHRSQSRIAMNNDGDEQQLLTTLPASRSSFLDNNNIDSSITGEDASSNNGKDDSYQSSLVMNQLINNNANTNLDARLLLDSSIDNNDSGQTVLTKRADSCTCWGLKSEPFCQQRTYPHQVDSNQQGIVCSAAHQQNNNISSNYSSSTAATMPPQPPVLQSTILSQHQSIGEMNNQYNQNNSSSSNYRDKNQDRTDCCPHDSYEAGFKKASFKANAKDQYNNSSVTCECNKQTRSVIISLTLPYDEMPHYLQAAIRHILFIADTIKNEDVENRAIEDWNFMSMVIDRLFLWLFLLLCSVGSFMLLMFAPSLYDNRPSIEDIFIKDDIPMNNCSAVTSPV